MEKQNGSMGQLGIGGRVAGRQPRRNNVGRKVNGDGAGEFSETC